MLQLSRSRPGPPLLRDGVADFRPRVMASISAAIMVLIGRMHAAEDDPEAIGAEAERETEIAMIAYRDLVVGVSPISPSRYVSDAATATARKAWSVSKASSESSNQRSTPMG